MKKIISLLIVFSVLLSFNPCYANIGVSAQSAILIEKNSGRILYSKSLDVRLPIASTTKIMTAICALENCDINSIVEVSATASGIEGSSMYLQTGEKMTVKELLYGLMLSSGNDAAVAISEAVSGKSEDFINLMNQKASEIGANSTHFTNPNGLPDDAHYSTAYDMAKITAYAMQNPDFCEIVRTKSYKIEGDGKAYPRVLVNHNKLLNMYDGCIGVKTGFTKTAGRCLVSAAERNGMTLICVTLNAPNDWDDHKAMFDYGFSNYEYKCVVQRDTSVTEIYVTDADSGPVPVFPGEDIYYPLKNDENISLEFEIYPEISAPLKENDVVGKLSFSIDNKKESSPALSAEEEISLIVKSDVARLSIFHDFGLRFIESLKTFFSVWTG